MEPQAIARFVFGLFAGTIVGTFVWGVGWLAIACLLGTESVLAWYWLLFAATIPLLFGAVTAMLLAITAPLR